MRIDCVQGFHTFLNGCIGLYPSTCAWLCTRSKWFMMQTTRRLLWESERIEQELMSPGLEMICEPLNEETGNYSSSNKSRINFNSCEIMKHIAFSIVTVESWRSMAQW